MDAKTLVIGAIAGACAYAYFANKTPTERVYVNGGTSYVPTTRYVTNPVVVAPTPIYNTYSYPYYRGYFGAPCFHGGFHHGFHHGFRHGGFHHGGFHGHGRCW